MPRDHLRDGIRIGRRLLRFFRHASREPDWARHAPFKDSGSLFRQATSQPKVEIFPESDKDYFLKVVDAQITFVTDARGRATELILHQEGADQHAKGVE